MRDSYRIAQRPHHLYRWSERWQALAVIDRRLGLSNQARYDTKLEDMNGKHDMIRCIAVNYRSKNPPTTTRESFPNSRRQERRRRNRIRDPPITVVEVPRGNGAARRTDRERKFGRHRTTNTPEAILTRSPPSTCRQAPFKVVATLCPPQARRLYTKQKQARQATYHGFVQDAGVVFVVGALNLTVVHFVWVRKHIHPRCRRAPRRVGHDCAKPCRRGWCIRNAAEEGGQGQDWRFTYCTAVRLLPPEVPL